MKTVHNLGAVLLALILNSGCEPAAGALPRLETRTLANGIRLAVVYFPNSTNASLFTFLPMGLTGDGPGQAQWAHLVEHLVIRSTMPNDLAHGNAETMADHMRLDFYGTATNWQEGMSHHHRWLEGVAFTEASLATEKPRVIAECEYTEKNLATHKFALAAWAQAWRHGKTQVAIKGDVLHAELARVQRHREEHLFVPDKTTVCLVGGVDAKAFFAEGERQLGSIQTQAKAVARVNQPHLGRLNVKWDLEARHLVLAWPIPDFGHDDYAALMAGAQWLAMQLVTDASLRQRVGQVSAGTDLATPEGNFFYVSASLRPQAEFEAVEKKIRAQISRLTTDTGGLGQISMLGQQLAFSLTNVPDPALLRAQAPPAMTQAMVEGNFGLGVCVNVHRYGGHRQALAKKLAGITPAQVQQAALKHLNGEKGSVVTLSRGAPTE